MSDIMNPTPVGFSIIDNGIDIAFGIQTNVDSAFVFKDSIVFNNGDDFFKLQIDDEIMKRMQKQKDVLIVTFGLSGPMDEYMIQLQLIDFPVVGGHHYSWVRDYRSMHLKIRSQNEQ